MITTTLLSLVACKPQNGGETTTEGTDSSAAPVSSAAPTDTTEAAPATTTGEGTTAAPETTKTPDPEPTGRLIYYQNFDSQSLSASSDLVLQRLSWTKDTIKNGAYKNNTSKYSIVDQNGSRMLYIQNNSSNASDSYVIVLTPAQFGAYHEQNYTYQYDILYTDASAADRYIALVSDYNGMSYNSFHFRNRGTANNQIHYSGSWYTYDRSGTKDYAANTNSNSIISKLLGQSYKSSQQSFSGISVSIRYVMDWSRGATVYMRVNTPGYPGSDKWTLVSSPTAFSDIKKYCSPDELGGGIAIKTGGAQNGYIDNIIIWEGTGERPSDLKDPLLTSKSAGCSGHKFTANNTCGDPERCIYCGVIGRQLPHSYASVGSTGDRRCTECGMYSSNEGAKWLLRTVPSYVGGKYSSALYRGGQGIDDPLLPKTNETMEMIISSTSLGGFNDYRARLKQYGYTEVYSYSYDNSIYAQYTGYDQLIYTYYTSNTKEVRVILDKSSDGTVQDFGYTYTKQSGDSTVLYQYGVPMNSLGTSGKDTDGKTRINCGMMYVIKLADNSVFVMDGGSHKQFDAAQRRGFMEFLREVTGTKTGKIKIAAWAVTHAHNDHLAGISLFFQEYSSQLTLERVFFNFPSFYSETEIFRDGMNNHAKLIQYLQKYFKREQIKFMQVHTGETFSLADIKVHVMYTHEDLVNATTGISGVAGDFNNSSMVLKIEFDGKSFWLLGDINKPAANRILDMYSDAAMRGDIVQIAHHVYNDIALYPKIQATVVFAPQTSGGAVANSSRKKILSNATRYANTDMVFYGGERTDGICVEDGRLVHCYQNNVKGGGYTDWDW